MLPKRRVGVNGSAPGRPEAPDRSRNDGRVARARTILPVVALALALCLPATPARADPRVETIARALRTDPVFVSSAITRSVPPAQVAALRRAVAGAEVGVFVVVAPSFGGEPGLGTLRSLPDLLHDRLGRDGIYLAVDLGPSAYAQAFGVEAGFDVDGLGSAVYRDRPDAGAGEAARYAVSLLTTGRRRAVPRRGGEESVQAGPVVAAGVGAGALGFALAGWPWLAARRRRRQPPPAAPAAPAAGAPALDPRALRDQARAKLAAVSGRARVSRRSPGGGLRCLRRRVQAARGRRRGRLARPPRGARARAARARCAARPTPHAVLLRPAPRRRQDPDALASRRRGGRHPGLPLLRAQGGQGARAPGAAGRGTTVLRTRHALGADWLRCTR